MGDILAQWRQGATSRAYAKQLSRIAGGAWAHIIPRMPAEDTRNLDQILTPNPAKIAFAPNLIGFALKALSYLYATGRPERKMVDEEADDWAKSRLWSFGHGLDVAMLQADRLSRLHGECLLHLIHAPSFDGSSGIKAYAIPRYDYEASSETGDPSMLKEVLIEVPSEGRSRSWQRWDAETWQIITGARGVAGRVDVESARPHGFGCLPFIRVCGVVGVRGEETTPFGGDDLLTNLKSIGRELREFYATVPLQRGQPFGSGLITKTLAPDAVIEYEQGAGNFGIAANNANLSGMAEAIQLQLDIFAKTMGLPTETFRVRGQVPSGVAILAAKLEMIEDRSMREVIFRAAEMEAHHKAAILWNAHEGSQVDGRLQSIIYQPWAAAIDPEQRSKPLLELFKEGLVPGAAVLASYYGESIKEAAARFDDFREDAGDDEDEDEEESGQPVRVRGFGG